MNHESQGYPFVTNPLAVKVLLVVALALGSGCAADDGADVEQGAITTGGTAAPTSSSTTVATSADSQPDEPATTVPEQLPEPAWAGVEFVLEPIAETDQGLAMATRSGDDHLWLAERDGRVRIMERNGSADGDQETLQLRDDAALDISNRVGTDGEGGLLGLDFSADGSLLYVSYTDTDGTSVIAEYGMDGDTVVDDSERVLLEVEQPFSNHNGGQITIGPDGFLYIALGDGGSGGDPLGSGQDTATLLGSILRIDPTRPTADTPFGIPAGNPFVDQPDGRQEIWLYGVRNPWRFSFDADTGDLWIGDVGQGEIEEIDFLAATADQPAGRGANLGWNILEGERPFSGEEPPPDLIGPIAWYGHDNGRCSVTGGYVYRGGRIEELTGVYLFGDFCSGEVFGLRRFADGRTTQAPVTFDGDLGQIVSFGQGPGNELYVFESGGTLYRIQPAP